MLEGSILLMSLHLSSRDSPYWSAPAEGHLDFNKTSCFLGGISNFSGYLAIGNRLSSLLPSLLPHLDTKISSSITILLQGVSK